jgi:polysaccharide export outer membrane protein
MRGLVPRFCLWFWSQTVKFESGFPCQCGAAASSLSHSLLPFMELFVKAGGVRVLVLLVFSLVTEITLAESYLLREGDTLRVSVWGEERLDRELRVLPDGSISYPLVGSVSVAGLSVGDVEALITRRIGEYIPEPDVSVVVRESSGNRIFVLGKVANSGSFPLYAPLSVVQALALAGGLTTFADENDIQIVRQSGGEQTVLNVKYNKILSGRDLSTNYRLVAGDTILVP